MRQHHTQVAWQRAERLDVAALKRWTNQAEAAEQFDAPESLGICPAPPDFAVGHRHVNFVTALRCARGVCCHSVCVRKTRLRACGLKVRQPPEGAADVASAAGRTEQCRKLVEGCGAAPTIRVDTVHDEARLVRHECQATIATAPARHPSLATTQSSPRYRSRVVASADAGERTCRDLAPKPGAVWRTLGRDRIRRQAWLLDADGAVRAQLPDPRRSSGP